MRDGFRVRMREAEYPDQNPARPFSVWMLEAIERTVGSGLGVLGEREERRDAVCLRVTMLEIGVVKNLEQAPARAPTPNSLRTGRLVASPYLRSLFVRR